MTETVTVGDLTFEIRRSARRKTLEITVDRGGELRVSAPVHLHEDVIDEFVRQKREWVYRKLAEKDMLWNPRATREFVTGEGFPYLGRSYRLKLVDQQDQPLKLVAGRFLLRRQDVAVGRDQFIRWYSEHGGAWITRRVPQWAARLGVEPAGVRVMDLGNRWGSCGRSGTLNFHWTTIQLPPAIVDYVITHELAHLQEPTHGTDFWRLVRRAMPDHIERKRWLAEQGQAHAGL